tara:strand:- start:73 stop:519 length:447 start_codon:yes stop_codon:yes gene_type:complete
MNSLFVEVVTVEKNIFSGEVDYLGIPAEDGDIGILPDHASLMTLVRFGELVIRYNNKEEYFALLGGFAEVNQNKVVILADACERIDSINEKRAQEAQLKAGERIATKNESLDIERALSSLRRADLRLKLAKKRKLRQGFKVNKSTDSS